MKTKLLMMLFFGICSLQAQTTHDLIWERNFTSPESDLTIETGDTVRWTWTDDLPHTVENDAGSTETFNSGTITGLNEVYTYTFTVEGVNPYLCGIHGAGNMSGIITVVDQLSVDEFDSSSLIMFPNPVITELQIKLPQNMSEGTITFFDLTGKQVLNQLINSGIKELSIDVSQLKSGMYFIKYQFGEILETRKLIIK
ncbi:cupredoxin domain-containing protein [Xanthomarina spongicola]|uniref:Putative secreted protein (Por secretion system target) n=1 Tax=Xanthomarina spongicola TaxID=570520 RepID=A0A316DNU1_9FLAO|nr:T9SS type A sorting domain-containing protein [Xanthomarina spongicola]PWK19605.1 putative secreted protein (Por secretion system target) [Xanthomarina spongicola]